MLAIVLGSGLNSLNDHISIRRSIPYGGFLDFDIIPLEGHERILYEAELEGHSLLILSGKLHLYEGYSYSQCIAPLHYVSENYSISKWIITSASGSFNAEIEVGKWQKISSLLTLENIPNLQTTKVIDFPYISNGIKYAFQKGPSLGTVAEYKMLANFGADLIGMSMFPESIFLTTIKSKYNLYSLPVCSYQSMDYSMKEPSHKLVIEVAQEGVLDLLHILKKEIIS